MKFSRVLRYQYLQLGRLVNRLNRRAYWVGFGSLTVLILFFSVTLLRQTEPSMEPIDFGALPDFSTYSNVSLMKADFFDYLQPIVSYHNSLIKEQRFQLQVIYQRLVEEKDLRSQDREFLLQLSEQYDYELEAGWELKVEEALASHPIDRSIRQLLLKVDEVPLDLALVQAAKESGWGRSRFAIEANNLFGHWCYSQGCGLVPEQRTEGAAHEVRKFDSIAGAIGSYMNNLNSYYTYETLRLIRGGLRSAGDPVTGTALADGLIYYSQRREAYVDEIKVMIRQYHEFQQERHTGS